LFALILIQLAFSYS